MVRVVELLEKIIGAVARAFPAEILAKLPVQGAADQSFGLSCGFWVKVAALEIVITKTLHHDFARIFFIKELCDAVAKLNF